MRALKLYAGYGPSMSVSNSWRDNFSLSNTDLNLGHNGEVGVIIMDSVQLSAFFERLQGVINGTETQTRGLRLRVMPKLSERTGMHIDAGINSTQVNTETGREVFNQQTAGGSLGFSF